MRVALGSLFLAASLGLGFGCGLSEAEVEHEGAAESLAVEGDLADAGVESAALSTCSPCRTTCGTCSNRQKTCTYRCRSCAWWNRSCTGGLVCRTTYSRTYTVPC